jgi:hypothetical protein
LKIIGKETQKKLDLQEKALKDSIKRLEAEVASLATKSLSLEKELAQQKQVSVSSKADVAQLQQQIEATKKELQNKTEELASSKADGDLLLQQLHQVQEELETVFLKEQASQSQLKTANAKLAEAVAAKDTFAKDKDALAKEKASLTADKAALTADRDTKAKQLADAVAAKDALAKDKDALAKEKASLAADKASLTTDRDTKAKQLAEAVAVKDALTKDKDALSKEKVALQAEITALKAQLTSQQRELKQENDLMLLQLHQVQEELEHYFLENQKQQKAAQAHTQRWQRLEARLPNYLDYETIAPVAVDSFSDTPTVDWQVTNCTLDGHVLPELKFATCLVNGKVGLRIGQVELIPRALVVQNFRNISTTEWRKIRTAATAIEYYFATNQASTGNAPEDFDLSFWKQTLLPLVADIRALPSVFRYTTVQLKRELINPDYEHLWLVFTDASYGRQTWPKFEMRLGAANIQPGSFSKYPKLEFPRIDGKTQPFDSWFEESWDDFGGKLELRFDLNKQLADLGVWTKLSQQDQALLLSFIALLPSAIEQLQNNKVAISRLWADWAGLINGSIETLRKLLAPKPASVEATPVSAAEPPKKLAAPVVKPSAKSKVAAKPSKAAVTSPTKAKPAAKKVAAPKAAPSKAVTKKVATSKATTKKAAPVKPVKKRG